MFFGFSFLIKSWSCTMYVTEIKFCYFTFTLYLLFTFNDITFIILHIIHNEVMYCTGV